jgi:hypothetical protein
MKSDEVSVVAHDPEAQKIAGKYLLGKSNVRYRLFRNQLPK